MFLVELLKDKLKASAPSRLVWTTSAAESFGYIDWSDLAYAPPRLPALSYALPRVQARYADARQCTTVG